MHRSKRGIKMNKSNEEGISNNPISTMHNFLVLANIGVCLHKLAIDYDSKDIALYGDKIIQDCISLENLEKLYKKLIKHNFDDVLDYFINNIDVPNIEEPNIEFWNKLLDYCVLNNKKEIVRKNFYLFIDRITSDCFEFGGLYGNYGRADSELEYLYKLLRLKADGYMDKWESYKEKELEKLLGVYYRPDLACPKVVGKEHGPLLSIKK